jgi:hypothetical protein
MTGALGSVGLLTTAFWVWMIYDCIQNERDRQTWLWILIFLNLIGASLYFVVRWMPRASIPMPRVLSRWTRRDALWQAEAEAANIGKAQQYIKLGMLLHEMSDRPKAAAAYAQALEREPQNARALWGAAIIAIEQKQLDSARNYLETLINVQPDFMYGDASLTYGRVLFQLGDMEGACAHLEEHLRQWAQPEAYLLLAKIQKQQGDPRAARIALETMILKIKSSAPFHYRKHRGAMRQGERMLRALAR